MKKTINIALDYKRVTAQPTAIPALVAGDTANRMVITLTDAGVPVDLTDHKVLVVFSKVSDGTTVEQDTEDAFVDLEGIGIEYTGTPTNGSKIKVTESKVSLSAETDIPDGTVEVSQDFRDSYPNPGEYVFHFDGLRWMYGEHSVKIEGNVVTVDPVKSGSYGNGKNNCELIIMKDSEIVTTAQFNFDGRRAIVNDETIQAQEKFPILVQLIQEVSGIKKGSGFMAKDEYDSNGDGVVNAADFAEEANLAHDSEALGGHSEEYYATNDRIDNLTPDEIGAAVPAVSVSVSIPTDGWTASGEGFVKTVNVSGILSSQNVIVTPAPDSYALWTENMIRAIELGAGTVKFYADSIPASTVKVNLMVSETGRGGIGGTGTPAVGGVQDVTVNGESVVTDGVASIPFASTDKHGVVLVDDWTGLTMWENGKIATQRATNENIENRNNYNRPIVPSNLDYAVKAALADGKGAAYSDAEKAAARERIGLNDRLVLIESVDIGGVNKIYRNAEPDRTAYNFRDFAIRCCLRAGSGSPNLTINGSTVTFFPTSTTVDRYSATRCFIYNGSMVSINANGVSGWVYQSNLYCTPSGVFDANSSGNINRFELSATTPFTENSFLEIYGVRA